MTATRSFLIAAGLATVAVIAAIFYITTRPAAEGPGEIEQARVEGERPAPVETVGDAIQVSPPSFDTVRVDPRGTAVMAGRGEPGASLQILADETPIEFEDNGARTDRLTVNERGEWVIILTDPLPSGSVQLSLAMTLPDGRVLRSEDTVIVLIPEARDATPLVVFGRAGDASRVEQGPFAGVDVGPLVLDTIDYDETGAVIFSGRAEIGHRVRVFANGAEVGQTGVGPDGRWTMRAGASLAPGVYDLQIDQIDAAGRVTAVIALPFERIAADALDLGPDSVVVQPGNSLWRIARRLYGSGVQYTVIYEANRNQIRNPDLIYPGQVLATPEDEAGPGGEGG